MPMDARELFMCGGCVGELEYVGLREGIAEAPPDGVRP